MSEAEELLQLALVLDDDDLLMISALFLEENNENQMDNYRFNFNKMSNNQCWETFRFEKEHIALLTTLLRIPNEIHLPNRCTFVGQDALCITLHRLSYPCRLKDLVKIYGRSTSALCQAINWTVNHIINTFGDLLLNLNKPWLIGQNLDSMATAINVKGCPLERCWGFIDGTTVQICRPKEHQRELFSGHKRFHCIKFQSVVTPNGLISSLMGPYVGRRHDAGIFHESGIYQQLLQKVNANGVPFYLYGDSAYPISECIITPYKGANITDDQHRFNEVMSNIRVCVEWSFGDIARTFAFVDFHKNMKLYLQPVAALYKVSAIFANCRTCLYGNQTSSYFNLQPPTIQQYLTRP